MTQQTASSLAEFYTDPASPYSEFPQQHRSAGSMPVTMIRAEQDAHDFVDPAVPNLVLCQVVKADSSFRWDIGDGWTSEQPARAGDFELLPPDTEAQFECDGPHELILLAIPRLPLEKALDEHRAGTLSSFDPLTGAALFRDDTIRRTMMQMWAESARSGGTSDLLMDGLTQVLIARLLDKAGALRRPQIILPLSEAELTRLDEMIAARIAERLTVEDLAQTLEMPRWTFADAFKATTGDTPHAYVTGKRVERACELLRIGEMPLAEIAYATGFASQSHMTDTFRRVLGTTPGKWRAEVRG